MQMTHQFRHTQQGHCVNYTAHKCHALSAPVALKLTAEDPDSSNKAHREHEQTNQSA